MCSVWLNIDNGTVTKKISWDLRFVICKIITITAKFKKKKRTTLRLIIVSVCGWPFRAGNCGGTRSINFTRIPDCELI